MNRAKQIIPKEFESKAPVGIRNGSEIRGGKSCDGQVLRLRKREEDAI